MENKTLQATFTAAAAAFVVYCNTLAVPLIILVIAMLVDYITGITSAYINRELSSKVGLRGIVKKISYMALVAVAMGADYLIYGGFSAINIQINYDLWFSVLVTIWLVINEMISILENLVKIGVPIPGFLTKLIGKLKTEADKENE